MWRDRAGLSVAALGGGSGFGGGSAMRTIAAGKGAGWGRVPFQSRFPASENKRCTKPTRRRDAIHVLPSVGGIAVSRPLLGR